MTSSHSFHSLEAEKGPISFTFRHTHTGMVGTKSPPWATAGHNRVHRALDATKPFFICLQVPLALVLQNLIQSFREEISAKRTPPVKYLSMSVEGVLKKLSQPLAGCGMEPRPLVWEVDTLSSRPQAEAQATVVQGRAADWEQLLEQVLGYSSCSGSRHEWGWSRGCGTLPPNWSQLENRK